MNISTEIRFGVYLGLAFCLYTIFMWLTKLDTTYLSTGRYLNTAVIILPLTFTFLAIWAKSKEINLTLMRRIRCSLSTNLVAYLIHLPTQLFYHHFSIPIG
jgi:hypothetical protein